MTLEAFPEKFITIHFFSPLMSVSLATVDMTNKQGSETEMLIKSEEPLGSWMMDRNTIREPVSFLAQNRLSIMKMNTWLTAFIGAPQLWAASGNLRFSVKNGTGNRLVLLTFNTTY